MTDRDVLSPRAELVGNRLALAGAIVYLLEWVAIVAVPPPEMQGPGTGRDEILTQYAAHAGGATMSAAWFAVVLLGRVLFLVGLRASLRHHPRERPLLDFAVGAMAVSVAMEIASYGIVAAAAGLAADGAAPDTVVALDAAAYWVNLMLFGPVAVAVLAGSVAMLRSGLFPAWIGWTGGVAGVTGVIGALCIGVVDRSSGAAVVGAATTVAALGMWVWMIAAGIVLVRHRAH